MYRGGSGGGRGASAARAAAGILNNTFIAV